MGLFDEKSYSYDTTKSITELDNSSKEMEKEVEKIQSDPFSGGAPGLVPESTLDTQDKYLRGDGTWHTPAGGGGGGTENYEDLANKPAIDGTELDKDSTAEGLGLAKLTDLPDMSDVVHDDDLEPYAKKTDLPTVPTKVSELQNDSGFITGYTETDPTVPSWAKQESKPTYSKSEVGLSNVDNTSDANKPVSTATQAALDLKQDKLTAGDGIDISEQNVISLNPTFGFTPVGTIISVMGNTAPTNYLACNGQTVNIADYPELAAYFEAQFGTKNHFGGNGTTTFGIPDLRGEFLRGTGTNSHTGEGSGANVGTHQDGTQLPVTLMQLSVRNFLYRYSDETTSDDYTIPAKNRDADMAGSNKKYNYFKAVNTVDQETSNSAAYTTRPTNTSVLYCIATKNIYLNPALDYSTSEKVVGHWIDGKPLYQKSFSGTIPQTTDGTVSSVYFEVGSSVDTYVNLKGVISNSTAKSYFQIPRTFYADSKTYEIMIAGNTNERSDANKNKVYVTNSRAVYSGFPVYVTIQYTKTTY